MAAWAVRLRTHAVFFVLPGVYAVLALNNIGFLAGFTGDETAYRTAAWEILGSGPATNLEHPLLAKTLQAFGAIFAVFFHADPVVGMRIVSVLAGALALAATYAIGAQFASPAAGLAASVLLLGNTMFFVHARLISPEMTAIGFLMAGLYLFLIADDSLSGAFLGLSLAAKWIGVWLVPWALVRIVLARGLNPAAKFLGCCILLYTLGNAAYFRNHTLSEFFRWPLSMLSYHEIHAPNSPENGSPAWTWFTVPQQLYYARLPSSPGSAALVMSAINPVVFVLVLPALIAAFWPGAPRPRRLLAEAALCLYAPWLFVARPTYVFYALTVIPILAVLEAMLLMSLREQGKISRALAVVALGVSFAAFVPFYPAAVGRPIGESHERALARLNFYRRPVHYSMFCQSCNKFFGPADEPPK